MSANTSNYGTTSNSVPETSIKTADPETASIASHSSAAPLLPSQPKTKPKATTTWTEEQLMRQAFNFQIKMF